MGGKYVFVLGSVICLFLISAVTAARADTAQSVSPIRAGEQIMPVPPTFDYENIKPLPPIHDQDPGGGVVAVPESSTVSMMILGFGTLGAIAWFRKSRKA